jgi:hypothetical protein
VVSGQFDYTLDLRGKRLEFGKQHRSGGALHNADREIVRPYKRKRWITCVLKFPGRHRVVMSPNRYTELFFLDEAVAFAAIAIDRRADRCSRI